MFHGIDDDEKDVYTIGRRNNKYVVPAIEQVASWLQKRNRTEEKKIISNTSPIVPFVMSIGGILARGLHGKISVKSSNTIRKRCVSKVRT
ncbi:DUF3189 family protein [Gracilibacillus salinarum]|uniref:DUF3189 family protein n=1 Tax=Gracilibacillus salinarum TaxID=2932255 RepID=UPI0034E1BEBB